jgi:HD-GYP domain-containing protein (c-di-GMP phosphodiesterase class II)
MSDPLPGQISEPQTLYTILERANQIASTTELDELLERMLDLIIEVCGATAGTLYLVDRPASQLVFKVVKGDASSQNLLGMRIGLEQGIAGACLRERQPILVDNVAHDPRWHRNLGELSQVKLGNAFALPLFSRREPIGVVQVFNFDRAPVELIQLLANRMASEIEKAILLDASQKRSDRLKALIAIIGQIGSTLDRDQILGMILNYARELLGAEASSLFLKDEDTGDLVLYLASNIKAFGLEEVRVPPGKGIIGHVVATGQTVLVADAPHDARHYPQVDQLSGFSTRSILAVPLHTRSVTLGVGYGATSERIIGGLEAINKIEGAFSEEDAQLLRTLANQAATVLQIAELYADANKLFDDVIEALTASIDAKDPYTQGHSRRVRDFSVAISQELGLPQETIRHIWVGSLLHDVGKIGVPDAVLSKPERLTHEEFEQMKEHPVIGKRILAQIRALRSELAAIAEHHERLDGSGYPDRLSAAEISLTGRIVAVADVFDALTSDRPYRAAMPVEQVFEYLRQISGAHLDPVCVEALVRAYRKGNIKTQKEAEAQPG